MNLSPEAAATLWLEHEGSLLREFRARYARHASVPFEAEDLASDLLVRLLEDERAREQVSRVGLRSWARMRVLDSCRALSYWRRSGTPAVLRPVGVRQRDRVECLAGLDLPDRVALKLDLEHALEQLNEGRAALVRRRMAGATLREAGAARGASESAAMQLERKAHAEIAARMAGWGQA